MDDEMREAFNILNDKLDQIIEQTKKGPPRKNYRANPSLDQLAERVTYVLSSNPSGMDVDQIQAWLVGQGMGFNSTNVNKLLETYLGRITRMPGCKFYRDGKTYMYRFTP